MKILYAGMKYDYGDKDRGLSFEETNFYDSLIKMGYTVIPFDFMTLIKEFGRDEMNKMLLDEVQKHQPDILFSILFTNEFNKETINEITKETDTLTLNWFCDDHWRFDNFSRHWAGVYDWVVTTDEGSLPKYKKAGHDNVILSQWACNHYLYKPYDLPIIHDVTFVGQPHGNRKKIINKLKKSGINIETWGYGWENGRLTQEDMIKLFSQSKINLNLSNASRISILPWKKQIEQIKGRNFEVPGCGGFLLSSYVENIEKYYQIGKEIVCYQDENDLIKKIKYYLKNDNERQAIAKAGFMRTIHDHTYEIRFKEIFKKIGLQ